MKTLHFQSVFVGGCGTAAGPMEAHGPLKDKIDKLFDDIYCEEKTYEQAERRLMSEACDHALRAQGCKTSDLDLILGGDLLNQLGTSHYFARDLDIPFIGLYGACSNSTLIAANAAMWIDSGHAERVLGLTSSHNATAERQFRYPNEYGVQKPETTTYTVTGAGAMIFQNEKTPVRLTQATLGRILDWQFTNSNDMGSAMAPAAFDTICRHFENTGTSFDDYDLIVTGDLSKIGRSMLIDLFKQKGMDPHDKLIDCGLLIYDREHQEVFAGGSGCACSAVVTIAYLFDLLRTKALHKIMVVATGALLSTVIVQQKESIPCIAHAVVYEGTVGE